MRKRDGVQQGEGRAMRKRDESGAKAGECVSEPTLHQCFSPSVRSSCVCRSSIVWGLLQGVDAGVCGVCGRWVGVSHGERKASTNDSESVSVSRVGGVYVASVGRVRVAGACPLLSLAQACEWASALVVRV